MVMLDNKTKVIATLSVDYKSTYVILDRSVFNSPLPVSKDDLCACRLICDCFTAQPSLSLFLEWQPKQWVPPPRIHRMLFVFDISTQAFVYSWPNWSAVCWVTSSLAGIFIPDTWITHSSLTILRETLTNYCLRLIQHFRLPSLRPSKKNVNFLGCLNAGLCRGENNYIEGNVFGRFTWLAQYTHFSSCPSKAQEEFRKLLGIQREKDLQTRDIQ